MSDLDFDRVAWINGQAQTARDIINGTAVLNTVEPRFLFVLGVVEEFAELLRVHYAGGDA